MFDAAVGFEVERSLPCAAGQIEIALGDDQLILQGRCHSDDFAGRGDDAALPDLCDAFLYSGLGDAHHPARILVRARLHAQVIVKTGQVVGRQVRGIVRWRVVPEEDHLRAFEGQHAVGFRPTAIITNARADDAAECTPGVEPKIPDIEIELFEILERMFGNVLGNAGEMNLAELADDPAIAADQH